LKLKATLFIDKISQNSHHFSDFLDEENFPIENRSQSQIPISQLLNHFQKEIRSSFRENDIFLREKEGGKGIAWSLTTK